MKKTILIVLCFIILSGCNSSGDEKNTSPVKRVTENGSKIYSTSVKDTFFISVCLPENIAAEPTKKYPVIFLLDANLYFDVMASAFKRYSEVGLLPEAILVGIGYKDLLSMDSLRNRDYTFPKAIPEYEMHESGKAPEFLKFIQTELIPRIDSSYAVDKHKRVLMGHSLGGYFTLYATLQNTLQKNDPFSAYIAASPSVNYDDYYILKEFEKMKAENPRIKVYSTFGGLEDEEDPGLLKNEAILRALSVSLKEKNKIVFKGDVYSNLDHMSMAFPTFVKGIQWIFTEEQ
jgi:uncharacterized protein